MFFAHRPVSAVLADNNADLINCYIQVRENPAEVIAHLSMLENNEEGYYRVRESDPARPAARAARLIYLTTLAFNGIHRLNLSGQFNVPYGYKTHLNPCDPERIYAASRVLTSATLLACDFANAVSEAQAGDVVYLDPPYTVAHQNNGFVKYNAKIFSWEDQIRLAGVCKALAARGCRVIISNADHPSIHKLYSTFKVKKVERASRIAASGTYRRRITESLFHNGD